MVIKQLSVDAVCW